MKQLSSFMVLSINGGDRISYTYDEINAETGELVSSNNKKSFYAVDSNLTNAVEQIRKYLKDNKLED